MILFVLRWLIRPKEQPPASGTLTMTTYPTADLLEGVSRVRTMLNLRMESPISRALNDNAKTSPDAVIMLEMMPLLRTRLSSRSSPLSICQIDSRPLRDVRVRHLLGQPLQE